MFTGENNQPSNFQFDIFSVVLELGRAFFLLKLRIAAYVQQLHYTFRTSITALITLYASHTLKRYVCIDLQEGTRCVPYQASNRELL